MGPDENDLLKIQNNSYAGSFARGSDEMKMTKFRNTSFSCAWLLARLVKVRTLP
jgi:hypothetical protein